MGRCAIWANATVHCASRARRVLGSRVGRRRARAGDGRHARVLTSPKAPQSIGDVTVPRRWSVPPFPLASTFKLHSHPGANRVIYLDFDGETLLNTGWNELFGLTSVAAVGYDADGNPLAFSDSEKTVIQTVWQRVRRGLRALRHRRDDGESRFRRDQPVVGRATCSSARAR